MVCSFAPCALSFCSVTLFTVVLVCIYVAHKFISSVRNMVSPSQNMRAKQTHTRTHKWSRHASRLCAMRTTPNLYRHGLTIIYVHHGVRVSAWSAISSTLSPVLSICSILFDIVIRFSCVNLRQLHKKKHTHTHKKNVCNTNAFWVEQLCEHIIRLPINCPATNIFLVPYRFLPYELARMNFSFNVRRIFIVCSVALCCSFRSTGYFDLNVE